jgi:tetratricopeptide (TPR) repeat protein
VAGHRFGRWLTVEPDASALEALERACLLDQRGAEEEAIAVLAEALDENSASPALHEARGALYFATGFPRAAVGDFQRAVALAPRAWRGHFALGRAYHELGLGRQAKEALAQAHALGGCGHELELTSARVHATLGHMGSAARHYRAALNSAEGSTLELEIECIALATQHPSRAAIEAIRERLEGCGGMALSDDAWLLRALVREMEDEPPEAVRSSLRALDFVPGDLAALAESLLFAVQLLDVETSALARTTLLQEAPNEARREALKRCLADLP